MTTRRIIGASLFILCSLLIISGCSSSTDVAPEKSKLADEKVLKAVKDYQQAIDKLSLSQKQSEEAAKAAAEASALVSSAKKKADELEQMALNNKKDPNDPKQAPKTFEARKQHREAEALWQAQVKKAEDAEAQLKLAQGSVDETEKALQNIYSNRGSSSTGYWLLSSLAALVLAVFIGGFGFFIVRKVKDLDQELFSSLKNITNKQEEFGNQIKALSGLLNPSFASFKKEIDSHFKSQKEQMAALSQKLEIDKNGAGRSKEVEEESDRGFFIAGVGDTQVGSFPITAREYLNRFAKEATAARDDPLHEGILVNDPNGAFILVRDSEVRDGLTYAIPKVPYFRSQEFYTYYDKYYTCKKPSPGEVTIVEPATVDKVDGGWKLRDMGILEVNKS